MGDETLKPIPVIFEGRKAEMVLTSLSEGLTDEIDMEVKESLLAMQVRFLKHGRTWTVQRFGTKDAEHVLISTKSIKSAQFFYHKPDEKVDG